MATKVMFDGTYVEATVDDAVHLFHVNDWKAAEAAIRLRLKRSGERRLRQAYVDALTIKALLSVRLDR